MLLLPAASDIREQGALIEFRERGRRRNFFTFLGVGGGEIRRHGKSVAITKVRHEGMRMAKLLSKAISREENQCVA